MPHLQITEAILVHCNIVNNNYQQDSRALYIIQELYTFVSYKLFV